MRSDTAGPNPDQIFDSICTNAALRRATRRLGNLYDDTLTPCGLRATQYSLLVQVERLGGPTMRALSNALVMDLSALSHTLKPLVRDGLLVLLPDPLDRRSRRVNLSAAGCAKLQQARALWQQAQHGFDSAFGAKKAAALRATLDLIASPAFAARMAKRITAAGSADEIR